jgi:hypothetical protein
MLTMMGVTREMEIAWEDLVTAFANTDSHIVFYLDKESGEIFSVPDDFDDGALWDELEENHDRYLRIPAADSDQERALVRLFLQETDDPSLRQILNRIVQGTLPGNQLEEILSFYPEERDKLRAIREEAATTRIKKWLEEQEIFFSEDAP